VLLLGWRNNLWVCLIVFNYVVGRQGGGEGGGSQSWVGGGNVKNPWRVALCVLPYMLGMSERD